jgi:hypothetical protein
MSSGLATPGGSSFVKGVASQKWGELYDTMAAPTGVTELQFFSQPRGTGVSPLLGAGVKRDCDTNMKLGNQFTAGESMQVHAMSLECRPGISTTTAAQDVYIVLQTGVLEIKVGDDIKWKGPIRKIPQGVGLDGFAASTVAAATIQGVHNGVAHPDAVYQFRQPFDLPSNTVFTAVINWPGAGPTLVNTVNLCLYFHGWRFATTSGR